MERRKLNTEIHRSKWWRSKPKIKGKSIHPSDQAQSTYNSVALIQSVRSITDRSGRLTPSLVTLPSQP